jgi:LemA protein
VTLTEATAGAALGISNNVGGIAPLGQCRVVPQAMSQLLGAEQTLTGALGRMFALSENYPDLKANQNMMQLSEELSSTENKIAFARQAFNDAVMNYNTAREKFPNIIFANTFGFVQAQLFEIEMTEEREAPSVSF